jgi:hypothetical protein
MRAESDRNRHNLPGEQRTGVENSLKEQADSESKDCEHKVKGRRHRKRDRNKNLVGTMTGPPLS